MKNVIKFILILNIAFVVLMSGCNQPSYKTTNWKDLTSEYAKLEAIIEKTDLQTKNLYDSIVYKSEKIDSLASDFKDITFNLKGRTFEILSFIEDLKIEITKNVEGQNALAIDGRQINTAKITMVNNSNLPSEILIGKNNDGRAFLLKSIIQDYKISLFEVVKNDSLITKRIGTFLNTDDQKNIKQGKSTDEIITWEKFNFQSQPLGSVLLILTQIQNDIKNAESETLLFIQNEMNLRIQQNEQYLLKK